MSPEDVVLKLGQHDSAIETLQDKQDTLFGKTDELLRIAITNQGSINLLHAKLDNGIKARLEEMCGMFKSKGKEIDEGYDDVVARLVKLERTSWVSDLFDAGWKKLLLLVIGFMIVSAMSNAAFWGYIKATVFKEKPGAMQSLTLEQKLEQHLQEVDKK
jgi:hypothetical protein